MLTKQPMLETRSARGTSDKGGNVVLGNARPKFVHMAVDMVLQMVHSSKFFGTNDTRTSPVFLKCVSMSDSHVFDAVPEPVDFSPTKVATKVGLRAPIHSIRKVIRLQLKPEIKKPNVSTFLGTKAHSGASLTRHFLTSILYGNWLL